MTDLIMNWEIIASGGVAGTLLTAILFRILPSGLVEFFLSKRMSRYNHDLDILLSRKIGWHQKERVLLKEIWEIFIKVNDNFERSLYFFSQIEEVKQTFDKYDKAQQKKFTDLFLSFHPALQMESKKISKNNKMQKAIREFHKHGNCKDIAYFYLDESMAPAMKFAEYFNLNNVLLRPHIRKEFLSAQDFLHNFRIAELKSKFENDVEFINENNAKKKHLEWQTILGKIRNAIQDELYPGERGNSYQFFTKIWGFWSDESIKEAKKLGGKS